jgi:hypothetical protein
MGISLLIPTRGRPESMERFARSVDTTVSCPENVEIVFGIDKEDTDSFAKATYLSKALRIAIHAKEMAPWHDGEVNLASYWNQCYASSKYDIIGYFGDDVIFRTESWDLLVKKVLDQDHTLMLSCNGLHHPQFSLWGNGGAVGYLFFTHKQVHNLFGYYLHESLRRYCMDTVLEFIYKKANRFCYREDLVTEHLMALVFPDKVDETHLRMSKWEKEGLDLFQSDTIQNEIIRCSDLLNDLVLKSKVRKGTDILKKRTRPEARWRKLCLDLLPTIRTKALPQFKDRSTKCLDNIYRWNKEYDYYLFLHTKKSVQCVRGGSAVRSNLLTGTVQSSEYISEVLNTFIENTDVGMIGSGVIRQDTLGDSQYPPKLIELFDFFKLTTRVNEAVMGTMFWVRAAIIDKYLRPMGAFLSLKTFFDGREETGSIHGVSGQYEHAFERIYGSMVRESGYRILDSASVSSTKAKEENRKPLPLGILADEKLYEARKFRKPLTLIVEIKSHNHEICTVLKFLSRKISRRKIGKAGIVFTEDPRIKIVTFGYLSKEEMGGYYLESYGITHFDLNKSDILELYKNADLILDMSPRDISLCMEAVRFGVVPLMASPLHAIRRQV